ncbi:MAG: hypothetical protein MI674_00250 [Cytophagales bacterium]|nr:hypothetical protein [Cytophagales bacterium]
MSMFFGGNKENEKKDHQSRTIFSFRRRREEKASSGRDQSLRADEAAYLQYIERSLDRKMGGYSSHSNRKEKEDLELLSRIAFNMRTESDAEWEALQSEILAVNGAATSGQEIAHLEELISRIDDWQQKNFGKGRFLSRRTHQELLAVYKLVKQLHQTVGEVWDDISESKLDNLAREAKGLKSGRLLFSTTFSKIKRALKRYEYYQQRDDRSNACAMRKPLRQLTTQWLSHAHTKEKVIVSQELKEVATLRLSRVMELSASQKLTPADLQAREEETQKKFEEAIAGIGKQSTRSLWNLWGLWGRDAALETTQKEFAEVGNVPSFGEKIAVIKRGVKVGKEWLKKNRNRRIGGFSVRTHQQLLNAYLFVKILHQVLNKGEVDLSWYARITPNLKGDLFQDIQKALKEYQNYRKQGDEEGANEAREKLNRQVAEWLENKEQDKIIAVHNLLDLAPQEIARLEREAARNPVKEMINWGLGKVRTGLRGGVNVAFDYLFVPIGKSTGLYLAAQAVGRWLPTRGITFLHTLGGLAAVYPFSGLIGNTIGRGIDIYRNQLLKGIDKTTKRTSSMVSSALETASNVSAKLRQMVFNPWGGGHPKEQSVTIGDVEQGRVVGGKEYHSQEMSDQEASNLLESDREREIDLFEKDDKFEALCPYFDKEGTAFYDAEEHLISGEEDKESAADKEGKAVTPSRAEDLMGEPEALARSVSEVKSTSRDTSWLYRLLKTLGIYSSS